MSGNQAGSPVAGLLHLFVWRRHFPTTMWAVLPLPKEIQTCNIIYEILFPSLPRRNQQSTQTHMTVPRLSSLTEYLGRFATSCRNLHNFRYSRKPKHHRPVLVVKAVAEKNRNKYDFTFSSAGPSQFGCRVPGSSTKGTRHARLVYELARRLPSCKAVFGERCLSSQFITCVTGSIHRE